MKKILFLSFFFLILTLFFPKPSNALTCGSGAGGTIRCAECDRCGYCYASQKAPGNWRQCATCLYEAIPTNAPANQNHSLEIKANAQGIFEQVTPAAGKYYTQLGCIDTDLTSFSNASAAGGVLNFLLTRLIFPTVGVLAFLSLIYGSFLLITAQSEPERIARGRSYIIGAIVGLVFTLSVILIINTLAGDILKIPGFTRSPEAAVAVRASTAVNGGKLVNPVLKVDFQGREQQQIELAGGNQEIKVNIPVAPQDLNKPEILHEIVFSMKEDLCYSMTSRDRALCCDCAQDESAIEPAYRESWRNKCSARPLSASRIAQCKDRTNYNGDVNLYISSITINGKQCKSYSVNDVEAKPVIGISSTGSSVRCTSI